MKNNRPYLDELPILDGFWEQEGKKPLLGACILIIICGALYYVFQSITLNIYISADTIINNSYYSSKELDSLEMSKFYYSKYKYFLLILVGISQYLILLTLPVILIKKWHTKDIARYFQYDHLHIPGILLSITGIFFIIPLVDIISRVFYHFFPIFEEFREISLPLLTSKNPFDTILLILIISVTPAICEETLFRGYFQRTLQRKLKYPWHFIISGFIFALFHQQTLSLPALFFVGAYLGFIYYKFNSLYVSMASHLLYNLLLILLMNNNIPSGLLLGSDGYFKVPIVIFSLAIFVFILYKINTYNSKQKVEEENIIEQ